MLLCIQKNKENAILCCPTHLSTEQPDAERSRWPDRPWTDTRQRRAVVSHTDGRIRNRQALEIQRNRAIVQIVERTQGDDNHSTRIESAISFAVCIWRSTNDQQFRSKIKSESTCHKAAGHKSTHQLKQQNDIQHWCCSEITREVDSNHFWS